MCIMQTSNATLSSSQWASSDQFMRPDDLIYLEKALESFIWAAINRVSMSGSMNHQFRFTAAEMGRQRVRDGFVDEVSNFFAAVGAPVTFDAHRSAFVVSIDLDVVLMNPHQSMAFSTAMELYRAEHG